MQPSGSGQAGPRAVPRRRGLERAEGPDHPIQAGPEVPHLPLHGRRRRGPESPERLDGGQHGPALESGGPGSARRPGPSPGPAPAGARRQLRGAGDHRARHALGALVQAVPVRRAFWTAARARSSSAAPGSNGSWIPWARSRNPSRRPCRRRKRRSRSPTSTPEEATATPAVPAGPNWENLLTAGLTLLNQAQRHARGRRRRRQRGPGSRSRPMPATGQRHLKLPVPPKEVLRDIASFLSQLAEKL